MHTGTVSGSILRHHGSRSDPRLTRAWVAVGGDVFFLSPGSCSHRAFWSFPQCVAKGGLACKSMSGGGAGFASFCFLHVRERQRRVRNTALQSGIAFKSLWTCLWVVSRHVMSWCFCGELQPAGFLVTSRHAMAFLPLGIAIGSVSRRVNGSSQVTSWSAIGSLEKLVPMIVS